jgi:predicted RNA-binding protein (virulence factor B family)
MEIGVINKLKVIRPTEYGYFLEDEEENEVLLPNVYVPEDISSREEIEVFVYTDSEDRIVATTLTPYVQLEEFAYLQVKDVNKFGAFMDWGLPKDLLVPFSEQPKKMKPGEWHLVFVIKDEVTDRLIGSARIERYLYFDDIDLEEKDEVLILPYLKTELGINAVINNLYKGLIFHSDIHKPVELGKITKAYMKKIRPDGKIDLSLEPIGYKQSADKNTQILTEALKTNNGKIYLTDKSSPEEINSKLGISKKAFKRAVGNLYKQKIIALEKDCIRLLK